MPLWRNRWFVWGCIGVSTFAALFTPLLSDEVCVIDAWESDTYYCHETSTRGRILGSYRRMPSAVSVGFYFGSGCKAAVLVGVLLDPQGRFDKTVPLHRSALHYVFVFTLGTVSVIGMHWVYMPCPSNFEVVYGALQSGGVLMFVASMAMLSYSAVLRLRMVSTPTLARRVTTVFNFSVFCGCLTGAATSIDAVLPRPILKLIEAATMLLAIIAILSFQLFALFGFCVATREATMEAREVGDDGGAGLAAVRRAYAFVGFSAASLMTTQLYLAMTTLNGLKPSGPASWAQELAYLLNHIANASFLLFCTGLVGPGDDQGASFQRVASLVEQRRERVIHEKLVEAARARTGPALALAGLFEGVDPAVLVNQAVARFRCVSWDVVSSRPEIILDGGPLDGTSTAHEFYQLSEPCRLGECDAFLSHSWHDKAHEKWEALQSWCEDFKKTHQRSPKLWLDKVCIDQTSIKDDLQCLPVFLAACNTLLITSGVTYTSRLWCCTELFVYMNMQTNDETTQAPVIKILGADDQEKAVVRKSWRKFDASACKCFSELDKQRIFAVIDRFPGGTVAFSQHVRNLAGQLFEADICEGPSPDTVSEESVN